jgi:hypothetical protein
MTPAQLLASIQQELAANRAVKPSDRIPCGHCGGEGFGESYEEDGHRSPDRISGCRVCDGRGWVAKPHKYRVKIEDGGDTRMSETDILFAILDQLRQPNPTPEQLELLRQRLRRVRRIPYGEEERAQERAFYGEDERDSRW